LRPDDKPAGFQRWRNLLFLHWEVPSEVLAPLVPASLTVDTFEGKAWIGLVPFTMRDVGFHFAPPVPTARHFHETNLRTYVHRDGRDPGVWFFSLDAASTLAVVGARVGFHLPYFRASMRMEIDGDRVRYQSERKWPGPRPADLELSYRIGDAIGEAQPDSFEHFLAERYILYAERRRGGALGLGRVHHRPYPLRRARVESLRESIVRAAGLPEPSTSPHVLYSDGVDVDIFGLS
jgi:uncharacterized protein YqjF (DUF2071 family)